MSKEVTKQKQIRFLLGCMKNLLKSEEIRKLFTTKSSMIIIRLQKL